MRSAALALLALTAAVSLFALAGAPLLDPVAGFAEVRRLREGAGFLTVEAFRFLLGLFSRVGRDEVLDHPVRVDLFEAIREDPGIHLAEAVDEVDVGHGATRHHVSKLEEHDLVRREKHGGYVRLFPVGELTEEKKEQIAALRRGSNREVWELYRDNGDLTLREAADELDLSAASVHRSVDQLRDAGLLDP